MNRWLHTIIQGDMFYLLAFGLITPIFALFLRDQIPNVTLFTIGIAEAVFLMTLGILRPFTELSTQQDRKGWRTQSLLWFGSGLVVLAPFLYLLSRDMMDVFVIQMLYGIGIAFCEPAWTRLASRTCDIKTMQLRESYYTVGTLFAAGLALIGGFIAEHQGMRALFFYVGVTLLFASLFMMGIFWRVILQPSLKKI